MCPGRRYCRVLLGVRRCEYQVGKRLTSFNEKKLVYFCHEGSGVDRSTFTTFSSLVPLVAWVVVSSNQLHKSGGAGAGAGAGLGGNGKVGRRRKKTVGECEGPEPRCTRLHQIAPDAECRLGYVMGILGEKTTKSR